MMIRLFVALLANFILLSVYSQNASRSAINIIPKPVSLKVNSGSFRLDRNTKLVVKDEGDKNAAGFFNQYLQQFYGYSLNVTEAADKNYISFATRKFIKAPENDERYSLNGTAKSIRVEGDSYAGTFRGMQSLIQ